MNNTPRLERALKNPIRQRIDALIANIPAIATDEDNLLGMLPNLRHLVSSVGLGTNRINVSFAPAPTAVVFVRTTGRRAAKIGIIWYDADDIEVVGARVRMRCKSASEAFRVYTNILIKIENQSS